MTIYEELQRAQDEASEVQPIYKKALEYSLGKSGNLAFGIIDKGNTDGIIPAFYKDGEVVNNFLIILECKLDQSLRNDVFRAAVLLQVICYLKQIQDKGNELPRVGLIGTKKECFALPTNCLQKYVAKDIVGYNSASNAYKNNPSIVKEIVADDDITKYCNIYEVTRDFNIDTVRDEILTLAKDNKYKLEIEERSISRVFDYFSMHVLKERVVYEGCKQSLPPRIQKDLFMMMLLNPDDCYLHPNKKDTAIFGQGNERQVNRSAYIAFKNTYEFKYNREEKKKFTEICDRLIEDAERRNKGDFYTPTVWVDEAHKLMAQELGEDWKDKYIVWDCCCGTKNLTRDYKFRQLYSSTIEEGDIIIGKRYNLDIEGSHNVAFVYDFLNDDVELFERLLEKRKDGEPLTELDFLDSKLYYRAPGLVRGLLGGKSLVFLINPPYKAPGQTRHLDRNDTGISISAVNSIMKNEKIGASCRQLYAQFMFRIGKIKELFGVEECHIGLFSKTAIQSSSSFLGLRNYLSKYWTFTNGMLFSANQFAGCSDAWGVMFSVWKGSKTPTKKQSVLVTVKHIALNGELQNLSSKAIYNLDSDFGIKSMDDYQYQSLNYSKMEGKPFLSLSSPLVTKEAIIYPKNSFGCYVHKENKLEANGEDVYLLSGVSTRKGSKKHPIIAENYSEILADFTARRLFTGKYVDWINGKDEYMLPNLLHHLYKQFEEDSIAYSLFNNASYQSSIRNIEYDSKVWNIKNEFFFMSEKEMSDLAAGKLDREDINDMVSEDIENFGGDRFIYKKLQEITLSEDAQAVLDKAKELVRLSFKERDLFNMEHPEYHINTWDAGWYQIKGLLKEYHPKEIEDFNKLYKAFEDRMRPLVYELGFLYK